VLGVDLVPGSTGARLAHRRHLRRVLPVVQSILSVYRALYSCGGAVRERLEAAANLCAKHGPSETALLTHC